MIKGRVEIDLHNHRTGLRDKVVQENMVTNALQHIIDGTVRESRSLPDYITPLTTAGLGGLFLFDNTLTENANNVLFPSNAKLVARAGQYTDTENAKRGSLNVLESGKIDDDTYMNVWDFNTSQANGIIKSLSLTSAYAGQNLFGWSTFLSLGSGQTSYGRTMFYDEDEQYIYRSNYDGLVTKQKWYRTDFPIDRAFSDAFDPAENHVQLTLDGRIYCSIYNEGAQWGCCKVGDYLYFETYTSGGVWKLARVDLDTWTAECDLCELPPSTSSSSYPITYAQSSLCYANGCIYASPYGSFINGSLAGNTFIRKIDLSDFSYTDITIGEWGTLFAIGNLVYHSAGYFIYPDDTVVAAGTTFPNTMGVGSMPAPSENPLNIVRLPGDYGLSYIFPLNYLGTICNLAQPVEKTTSVTMKVKYTITNAE